MAIKISNNTIIDDSRVIVNASKAGIGTTNPSNTLTVIGDSNVTGISTANYFDGFFPAGDKVFNDSTTINNNKVNVALESDIIVGSGKTFTISTGSTVILNPFDFETSSVDELLVEKLVTVGFTSTFNVVTSGIASVAATSTSLIGFGTVVPPNIAAGLLVKEIPGVIAAGTTVVSFVSAGSSTGVSTITISPASLNTGIQSSITFKFGNFGENKSGIILDGETSTIKAGNNTVIIDGENSNITLGASGKILNNQGNPILNQSGSVLQVVHKSYQPGTTVSTSSTTFSDTGFSATITPISNSSRILVMASLFFDQATAGGNTTGGGYRIVRNNQVVWNGAAVSANNSPFGIYLVANGATDVQTLGQYNIKFIDDPGASLSPLTYKVQFAVIYVGIIHIGYDAGESDPRSDIILMEIAK